MQKQTNLHNFFKTRKRPAGEELDGYPAKVIARKLFDCDSPTRQPSTSVPETQKKIVSETEQDIPAENDVPEVESDASARNTTQVHEVEPNAVAGKSNDEKEDAPRTPETSPNSLNKLRKDLQLGEYKKILHQSKRLKFLRHKIDQFNGNKDNYKPVEEAANALVIPKPSGVLEAPNNLAPKLHEFDVMHIEVPTSPMKAGNLKPKKLIFGNNPSSSYIKKPYVSPRKLLDEGPGPVSPIKVPFEKFSHLIAADRESLVLPYKYLELKEVLRSMDIITKIKTDRRELTTFRKLKRDVQKMLGRNFTEKHLGQIKAVYPESYDYAYERIKAPFSNEEKNELVITRAKSVVNGKTVELTNTERFNKFHKLLLERTKMHHQEFLKTLDPPIEVDDNKLILWHPLFDLEKVPDIECALLPSPPVTKEIVSAKTILEKTLNAINVNNRMGKAVSSAANEQETIAEVPAPPTTLVGPKVHKETTAFQKALQGIPKSLLEKIRAKQAAKIVKTMTQTPMEAKERIMMTRLPELARILRNIYVSEKRGILQEDIVLAKVSHSYKEKLSNSDIKQHVKLITKHVPGWMNFCTVRGTSYIRLSKDADMTRVLGKLQKLSEA